MRETYELIVIELILTETSDCNTHTAIDIAVESSLRTIILLEVCDKLCGSTGKTKLLGLTGEFCPSLEDILL